MKAGTQKDLPYGSWSSPITAKFITKASVRLGSLSIDRKGELYWLEGRPQEKGRQVVVRYCGEGASLAGGDLAARRSVRSAVDVTPADANVRTRVHEYGGGAYLLDADGAVIYSDYASQRLYRAAPGAKEPLCLTPEGAACPPKRFRFADGDIEPGGERLICVREDHGPDGDAKPADVVNELVALKLDGSGDMQVLATGRDFYAHPRVSPDGARLCYVAWNHPAMPWDATELRVASLADAADAPATASHELVDGAVGGMSDADVSVLQPAWHPSSGALYYISDASGFYNLRRVPPGGSDAGAPLLPRDADFGGSSPGWQLGQQGYSFLHDGRVAATMPGADGKTRLLVFDESNENEAAAASLSDFGEAEGLPPMFGGITPAPDGTLYFMGGAPDKPSGVYAWEGLKAGAAGSTAAMLACSTTQKIPEGYVSLPKVVEFPCPLGTAHGYYYPPANAECSSSEAAPPLLVKAHGGPTGATSSGFNPSIQYFTSRGFAVLDVDYGGSTGYGRDYRRRLRGSWGIVDIDDVCAGAAFLVEQGLADPARLAIDGGSAGGYTTLGALAFKNIFTAGCSLYGVADLGALAEDTHKFESRYLDGLVGRYPEDKAVYDARAPINAVDQLSCPILLLQGDEDKIVPPNQAELMHAALLKKGLPCALKMYEGEQHGFRKAENIEDSLNSELYFYSKVFGFTAAGDDITPFPIDNEDKCGAAA